MRSGIPHVTYFDLYSGNAFAWFCVSIQLVKFGTFLIPSLVVSTFFALKHYFAKFPAAAEFLEALQGVTFKFKLCQNFCILQLSSVEKVSFATVLLTLCSLIIVWFL